MYKLVGLVFVGVFEYVQKGSPKSTNAYKHYRLHIWTLNLRRVAQVTRHTSAQTFIRNTSHIHAPTLMQDEEVVVRTAAYTAIGNIGPLASSPPLPLTHICPTTVYFTGWYSGCFTERHDTPTFDINHLCLYLSLSPPSFHPPPAPLTMHIAS